MLYSLFHPTFSTRIRVGRAQQQYRSNITRSGKWEWTAGITADCCRVSKVPSCGSADVGSAASIWIAGRVTAKTIMSCSTPGENKWIKIFLKIIRSIYIQHVQPADYKSHRHRNTTKKLKILNAGKVFLYFIRGGGGGLLEVRMLGSVRYSDAIWWPLRNQFIILFFFFSFLIFAAGLDIGRVF